MSLFSFLVQFGVVMGISRPEGGGRNFVHISFFVLIRADSLYVLFLIPPGAKGDFQA